MLRLNRRRHERFFQSRSARGDVRRRREQRGRVARPASDERRVRHGAATRPDRRRRHRRAAGGLGVDTSPHPSGRRPRRASTSSRPGAAQRPSKVRLRPRGFVDRDGRAGRLRLGRNPSQAPTWFHISGHHARHSAPAPPRLALEAVGEARRRGDRLVRPKLPGQPVEVRQERAGGDGASWCRGTSGGHRATRRTARSRSASRRRPTASVAMSTPTPTAPWPNGCASVPQPREVASSRCARARIADENGWSGCLRQPGPLPGQPRTTNHRHRRPRRQRRRLRRGPDLRP